MYPIRKVSPVMSKRESYGHHNAKFPFSKLEVGEGFFVPNKDKMPPAELADKASTLQNMQTHAAAKSRKQDKTFKAAIYPGDECWIQVWREK